MWGNQDLVVRIETKRRRLPFHRTYYFVSDCQPEEGFGTSGVPRSWFAQTCSWRCVKISFVDHWIYYEDKIREPKQGIINSSVAHKFFGSSSCDGWGTCLPNPTWRNGRKCDTSSRNATVEIILLFVMTILATDEKDAYLRCRRMSTLIKAPPIV